MSRKTSVMILPQQQLLSLVFPEKTALLKKSDVIYFSFNNYISF